jgi:hypothetical protein
LVSYLIVHSQFFRANGRRFTRERIDNNSTFTSSVILSGIMQPSTYLSLFQVLGHDGFKGRFLICYPGTYRPLSFDIYQGTLQSILYPSLKRVFQNVIKSVKDSPKIQMSATASETCCLLQDLATLVYGIGHHPNYSISMKKRSEIQDFAKAVSFVARVACSIAILDHAFYSCNQNLGVITPIIMDEHVWASMFMVAFMFRQGNAIFDLAKRATNSDNRSSFSNSDDLVTRILKTIDKQEKATIASLKRMDRQCKAYNSDQLKELLEQLGDKVSSTINGRGSKVYSLTDAGRAHLSQPECDIIVDEEQGEKESLIADCLKFPTSSQELAIMIMKLSESFNETRHNSHLEKHVVTDRIRFLANPVQSQILALNNQINISSQMEYNLYGEENSEYPLQTLPLDIDLLLQTHSQ